MSQKTDNIVDVEMESQTNRVERRCGEVPTCILEIIKTLRQTLSWCEEKGLLHKGSWCTNEAVENQWVEK